MTSFHDANARLTARTVSRAFLLMVPRFASIERRVACDD